jgi:hypothetical protein
VSLRDLSSASSYFKLITLEDDARRLQSMLGTRIASVGAYVTSAIATVMDVKPIPNRWAPGGLPRAGLSPLEPSETAIQPALRGAIEAFWATLEHQNRATSAGDRGRRAAVTGGKHMDAMVSLLTRVALYSGVSAGSIFYRPPLELPGYFRPEKKWDFLIVEGGNLVAAAELKSQTGPSFGNNFNNRSEEAIGSGLDLSRAFADRPNPNGRLPWRGWLMLLEDAEGSRAEVSLREPHFAVDPRFQKTSYAARYAQLCQRLTSSGLYSASALVLATKARPGEYSEPEPTLSVKAFLSSLSKACAR